VGLVVRLDRRDEGGAVAILVAVLATVLFGLAAIVVDLGYARTIKSDAQSTVDAASLAGAGILSKVSNPAAPFTSAIDAIKASAQENFGTTAADWAACSATPPTPKWKQGGSGTDCILFNNNANNPTKLRVVLPGKHVDSFFGGLIGYGGMDVGATAQATIREEDVPGCALCVRNLLDTAGAVNVDGNAFDPTSSSSSSAGSGLVRPGGSITVQPDGAITFGSPPTPASGSSYSPSPLVRPVTDPLAGKPMPQLFPDPLALPATANTVTCGLSPGDVPSLAAGIYRNIKVTGPCDATGIIVVTGNFTGLHVYAGGHLSAMSSVIQLSCGTRLSPSTCNPSQFGGRLRIDPGGSISMFASPFSTEFSVVADPENRSAMTINGDLSVDKAIYGRSAALRLGANASVSGFGQISVASLRIDLGGAVNVSAAGGPPVPGPPFVGLFR
jgi:hypothetical protein